MNQRQLIEFNIVGDEAKHIIYRPVKHLVLAEITAQGTKNEIKHKNR